MDRVKVKVKLEKVKVKLLHLVHAAGVSKWSSV